MTQFVVFRLGTQNYAIDISSVIEITEQIEISSIPNADEHIEGIIKLREKIIPILNLKKRFGLINTAYEENRQIVITAMDSKTMGLMIDSAENVITIEEGRINQIPLISIGQNDRVVEKTINYADQQLLLIEVDKLISAI